MFNRSIRSCISFDSYIKPQLWNKVYLIWTVVYLLIPTSNHNSRTSFLNLEYVVYLLIPTSNHNMMSMVMKFILLYIFWFLHQTTTWFDWLLSWHLLYIFWFLHQTTTVVDYKQHRSCCISFDSYIKPQLYSEFPALSFVVYLLIPTSNHNLRVPILSINLLYIFWFLHQTTTFILTLPLPRGCISFDSYIKPQHVCSFSFFRPVVYLLIPTSNHN